jgi:haloacetate dehalogenase
VLWARDGVVGQWYDPLYVWLSWADDVRGGPLPVGHFLPEEAPERVIEEFRRFFSG